MIVGNNLKKILNLFTPILILEILEILPERKDINLREAFWINKCRDENPSLCLNIMIPKTERKKKKKE